ncbi:DUF2442 domain-containing protein [Sulfobacillus thermosulfidooxidans]|uniref:DUF2442 domain-containing protein n=1 Tax=Sulfobacillus thermosulfidooxidans TaxID=28034 RepID=UPI0006B45537|nr:DUF2442 domain-containing protein [Sulfobacillus thermosulfidooxidans]
MHRPVAIAVEIDESTQQLCIHLSNHGELRFPLHRFPRLAAASATQRQNCQIWGGGQFLQWPEIDEDISVPQLLCGVCSWVALDGPAHHQPMHLS